MRGLRLVPTVASLVLAGALAACGDDAGHKGPGEPAGVPSDRRAPAVATPPAPLPAPASSPVAAAATSGRPKISAARLAELSTLDLPGYERTVVQVGKTSLVVMYESSKAGAKGVKLHVIAALDHCGACRSMDAAAWRSDPALRGALPPVVAGDPGLVFDVQELELGAKRGIGAYRASFVANATSSLATHGYQAWFNDGSNSIRIDVSPYGPSPKTRGEMLAGTSRDEMAAAAKAVFALFASEF